MNSSNELALEWSNFGRDLLVSTASVPRGGWASHLCQEIREAVRTGSLHRGTKLPATRTLARDLALSRGVICEVYDQLKAEGYLIARPGSGTVVADVVITPVAQHSESIAPYRQLEHSPGLPDPRFFPRREWLRAYRAVLDQIPGAELQYPDPQGYLPLREELAEYLGRVRGLRASANHILIVNGYAQGLAIIAKVLSERGITEIAVEEPGSSGTRTQLGTWGLFTPPVNVDEDGIDIASLRLSGARAVLVTPAHHYPTGVVLAPSRRHELLDWVADEPGRYIIEDDYDAEYRYDVAPVGSLQPLNPRCVITGSSVSKTLSPALRLGWLVFPEHLIAHATTVKANFDLGNSTLDQATLAELLHTGLFDRHLRASRRRYRVQRQNVVGYLMARVPDIRMSGLDAGLIICIRLGSEVDDRALAARLKANGVRCEALSEYQQLPEASRGLVVDIVSNDQSHLDAIIEAIRVSSRGG